MLSIAPTHVIFLAGFLPGAKADCWVDRYVYRSSHIRGLRVIPLNLITPPPPPYSIKLYQLKYPYLN